LKSTGNGTAQTEHLLGLAHQLLAAHLASQPLARLSGKHLAVQDPKLAQGAESRDRADSVFKSSFSRGVLLPTEVSPCSARHSDEELDQAPII